MGLPTRASRNVWRKKTRTVLVVLALGLSIAAITSVYAGIATTNANTQDMIDGVKADTQQLVDDANANTQSLIDASTNSTMAIINRTITETQDTINKTLAYYNDTANETSMQLTKITVQNVTMGRPPTEGPLTADIVANISGLDGVADVVPSVEKSYMNSSSNDAAPPGGGGQANQPGQQGQPGQPGQPGQGRSRTDYIVKGVVLDPALDATYHLLPAEITAGTTLDWNDTGYVLIHEDLVDFFGAGVGDNITIGTMTFVVKGLYFSAISNNTVYMNITDAQELLGYTSGEVNYLDVYANDTAVVANVTSELNYDYPSFRATAYKDSQASSTEFLQRLQQQQVQRLQMDADRQVARLQASLDNQTAQLEEKRDEQVAGFETSQTSQVKELERDTILLRTIGNLIIVVLTVTVTLIVLFMMSYTIKERTREIGVFKSLGFSGRSITAQFVLEGSMVGLLGGVVGSIVAVTVGPILSSLMLPDVSFFEASRPSATVIVMAIALIALLGAVGSLYPAWMTSRRSPSEVMRND